MSAFAEKRTEVQYELASLQSQRTTELATIGKRVVADGLLPASDQSGALAAGASEASEAVERLSTARERVVAIGERLAELRKAREALERRDREITAKLDPHYQAIGENAFRVYHDNPLIDQEYADIFAPVLEAHEEIRQTRSQIARFESELGKKPFLENVVLRGRIIVLRNRLTARENARERLYRDAGKQIAATDFVTTIGDPGLDAAAGPSLETMEESRSIRHDISVLDDERSSLRAELESLGVKGRATGRLSEIDDELRRAEAERMRAYAAIGSLAIAEGLGEQADGETAVDDELRDVIESATRTGKAIADAQKLVDRLDAAISAERITADMTQLDASISRKRSAIDSLTAELERMEQRHADLEMQRKKAEKARGKVDDLLA